MNLNQNTTEDLSRTVPPPSLDDPPMRATREAWERIKHPTEAMLDQLRDQFSVLEDYQLREMVLAKIKYVSVLARLHLKLRRENVWN